MSVGRSQIPRLGDYEVVRLVARGNRTAVFEARRVGVHGFSRRVALKRLLPDRRGDPRCVEWFVHEARISAALNHPNLVRVVDFGEHEGELFLALEYVDGVSGEDLLEAVMARGRRVALAPALHIACQILRGLDHLHTFGVGPDGSPPGVHANVIPKAVLLGRSGDVKISACGAGGAYMPEIVGPRPGYLPPEILRGEPLEPRSDVYSVGALVTDLLLGERLYGGESSLPEGSGRLLGEATRQLAQRGRDLPLDLVALLQAMLASRPADRPPSAQDVAEELEHVATEQGLSLTDYGLSEYLAALGLVSLTSEFRERGGSPTLESIPPIHSEPPRSWLVRPSSLPPARAPFSTRPDAPVALERNPAWEAVGQEIEAPQHPTPYFLRRTPEEPPAAVSMVQVMSMLATGRLTGEAEVAKVGGTFTALSSIPDVARIAARTQRHFDDSMGRGPVERRPIELGSVARLLYQLAISRSTGLAAAIRDANQTRMYFERGVPTVSVATDPSSLLGEQLVHGAGLPRRVVDCAVEQAAGESRRVGEVLVANGAVGAQVVQAAALDQRRERLVAMLRWPAGEYWFAPGRESGEAPPCPRASPLPIITNAVLRAFALEDLARLMSDYRHRRLKRTARADRLTLALGLPLASARALSRAHHAKDVDTLIYTLVRERVAEPIATLQGVFVGLCAGVLVAK